MKKLLFGTFFLFTFYGCKKVGISEHRIKQNFFGNWELTSYEKNGENLISNSNFTRYNLIVQEHGYTPYSHGSFSSGAYCYDTIIFFDIDFYFDESTITFGENGYCNHPDAIDPLFYFKGNSIKNTWDIKKFSKRILKINNFSSESNDEIEMMFEKIKDKNYDR